MPARYEDNAGKHPLSRTYANFSEELIRKPDNTATCPFFIDKNGRSRLRTDLKRLDCRGGYAASQ